MSYEFIFFGKYVASATAEGTAYTTTGDIVSATASAQASSDISYEDALTNAYLEALRLANTEAQNSANIIDQTLAIEQEIGGTKGDTGPKGSTGPQGVQGATGPAGTNATLGTFIYDYFGLNQVIAGPGPGWLAPIYSASAAGLYRSFDGGFSWNLTTNFTGVAPSLPVLSVYTIGSNVYFGSNGSGLYISTDKGQSATQKTLTNNIVNGVYATNSGTNIYAATNGGLSISTNSGSSFVNYTTANGLGSNNVRGVYVTSNGTIYAATDNGLSISFDDGTKFVNYIERFLSNFCKGVYVTSNGTIYTATSGGLSVSFNNGSTFVNYTTANGLGSNTVNGVYVTSNGTIYAATADGLSVSFNNGVSFVNHTTANGLYSNNVKGVYVSGSTVYAATSNVAGTAGAVNTASY